MILEGDMQGKEQESIGIEKGRGEYFKPNFFILLIGHLLSKLILCIVGEKEFDDGSSAATIQPHHEELQQPHPSAQESDTCKMELDDGIGGATINQCLEELKMHLSAKKIRILKNLYYFVRSGDSLVFKSSPMLTSIQLLLGDILLDEYENMNRYYI